MPKGPCWHLVGAKRHVAPFRAFRGMAQLPPSLHLPMLRMKIANGWGKTLANELCFWNSGIRLYYIPICKILQKKVGMSFLKGHFHLFQCLNSFLSCRHRGITSEVGTRSFRGPRVIPHENITGYDKKLKKDPILYKNNNN